MEILKDNKIPLTDEEREKCLKEKAVWHHGPNGEESSAVWKSKNSKGKITYVTNTHRAYQTDATLDGAIKKYHDFIKDTASVKDQMVKVAVADGEFRDLKSRVDKSKDDIRDLNRESKDYESRLKKVEKSIDDLNVGTRRFWQERTTFTSLQRKIERIEVLEQEWKKYKDGLEEDIKNKIEKHTRARAESLSPSK